MANTKISNLTASASNLAASDLVPVVQTPGVGPVKMTGTQIKTGIIGAGSVSIASGKTFTASNTLTLAGTDGSTLNVGAGGTLGALATVTPGTGVATAAGNAVNATGGFITFSTFAPASGKSLTLNNTLTLAGTDGTTMTFPTTSATIARTDAGNTFTGNQVVSSGSFGLSGNISSAAWTTSGIRYANVAATLTDTSSTGTVATAYTDLFGGNTIAASNSTTFTNYYTSWFNAPTAGTNVTFTGKWAMGLGGSLDIQAGTVTTNTTPALNLTQTWNAAGVTFTGLKFNATDTASASGSLLLDLQTGSSSRISVAKDGVTTINGVAASFLNTLNITNIIGGTNTLTFTFGSNGARFALGTTTNHNISLFTNNNVDSLTVTTAGAIQFRSVAPVGWCSTNDASGTRDLTLTRAAAATLQLGAADAAAPVAQFFKVQSVVGSTPGASDVAGANFTIQGSAGRGSGAGGSIIFQVAPAGSAGTGAQNAYSTALTIAATKVITVADTYDIAFNSATGTKIGTATSQKIGFWNAVPIVQPTTAVAAATVAATGVGDVVAASTTFDGYTIPQIVKAMRNAGLLA